MHHMNRMILCLLAAMTAVMGISGSVLAGVEDYVPNDVTFYTCASVAYTYHTTDTPDEEIATVYFALTFDQGQAGYLQGADIKFTYDPTLVTFVEARRNVGWGEADTVLEVTPGSLTTVSFGITPEPGQSTIPISQSTTFLAAFDFIVQCQTTPTPALISIVPGALETRVRDGVNTHYVTAQSGRCHNGDVSVIRPYWDAWPGNAMRQLEVPGGLGTIIDVPIFVAGTFRLASADMKLSYDVNKLQFIELDDMDESITDTNVTFPTSGQIRLEFFTNQATASRHQFLSEVIGVLRFRAINNWQGNSTEIGWVQNPVFTIAQDAGTCGVPFSGGIAAPCTITIPQYLASYTTEFLDGGKIGLHDNQASLKIRLTNNFGAGRGLRSIVANLCLGTSLEKDGAIYDEAINFGATTYDGANGQEVSIWTEQNAGCLILSDTAQNMVSMNVRPVSGFTPPTTFANRFFPITYQTPFDSDPNYNALVKDTTGLVTLTNTAGKLTWDNPQVEYLMGEYYCPSVQGGSGLIAQSYYMRSSFDLHDFRVKIVVSGDHNIYDIALEPNVDIEEVDSTSYKWAILKAGAGWDHQDAGDTRVKFATFTYCYWGQTLILSLDGPPGPPPLGYWVTKSSTVSFVYDSPSGYFMKDVAAVDQHEVALGGTVVSRWWVNGGPPQRDLTGLDGLPTDYALLQNYPNPFNPTTDFWFALPEGSNVEISVYNITGQKVATLVSGWREAGFHQVTWDAEDMATGVYFYRLQTDKFTQSKKMILMK